LIDRLLATLGEPLFCFLYEYVVLGVVFFVGLGYCYRQGDVGLGRGRPRRNLAILLGGYLFYMAVHGTFQFVLATPPERAPASSLTTPAPEAPAAPPSLDGFEEGA